MLRSYLVLLRGEQKGAIMSKIMLLNIQPDEERVAIVEGNQLVSLGIETSATRTLKGNIYKGIVRKVEPSLQACFVDYGATKNGFLPRSEIQFPEGVDLKNGLPSINELVKEGQELMVQVVRDAIGNKGVTFSTFVTLAGRFLVLVPENERTAISRKISTAERTRIRNIAKTLEVPQGYGVIIRTAAEEKTQKEIISDLEYLKQLYHGTHSSYQRQKGLGLIYREADLGLRFIRDYLSNDIEEVFIDDQETHARVRDFMMHVMPSSVSKVRLDAGGIPLFSRFGIEEQVENTFARKVPLPSGGSIVIDQTEALVAIDVNSGRIKSKDIEDTAFRTNIEACKAIAAQLQLRDMGGLVVCDFIDMRDAGRRREVEKALKHEMDKDKARHRLGRISRFGMLELTRQRLRSTSLRQTFAPCEHCEGSGVIRSTPSAAMKVLRTIQEAAVSKKANVLRVHVPVNVANFLLNRRRRYVASLEEQTRCHIDVLGDPAIGIGDVTVEYVSIPREDLPEDKPFTMVEAINLHPSDPDFIGDETPEQDLGDMPDFDPGATQKIGSFFRKIFGTKAIKLDDETSLTEAPLRGQFLLNDDEDIEALGVETSKSAPLEKAESTHSGEGESAHRSGGGRGNRRGRQRNRRRPNNRGPVQAGSVEMAKQAVKTAESMVSEGNKERSQEDGENQEPRRRRRRRRGRRPNEGTERGQNTHEQSKEASSGESPPVPISQSSPPSSVSEVSASPTPPTGPSENTTPPPVPKKARAPRRNNHEAKPETKAANTDAPAPPAPPSAEPKKAPATAAASAAPGPKPTPAPTATSPKAEGKSWGQVIDLRTSGGSGTPPKPE